MATKYQTLQDPLVGVANAGQWIAPGDLPYYEVGGGDGYYGPSTQQVSYGDIPAAAYQSMAAQMGWNPDAWTQQYMQANPGYGQASQVYDNSGDINAPRSQAAQDYLASLGLTPKIAQQGSNIFTGLFDADGNLVNYDKHDTGEDNRSDLRGLGAVALAALGGSYLSGLGAAGTAAGEGLAGATAGELAGSAGLTQAGMNATLPSLASAGGLTAAEAAAAGGAAAGGAAAGGGSGVIAGGSGLTAGGAAAGGATLGGTTAGAAGTGGFWGATTLGIPNGMWALTAANTLGNMYASNKAASAQMDAAQKASDTQLAMYNQNRADLKPWMQAGQTALGQLGAGTVNGGEFNHNFGLADFQRDPGYDWRMQQGQQAIERSAAARGGALGGGSLKALTRYGQDYASNEYNNAYNRWTTDQTNRFNRLSSIAGLGQQATNTTANLGANTASGVASNQLAAGNAASAGYIGAANAINNGVGSLQSMYTMGNLMNNGGTPSWLSKLYGKGP